ncbi:Gfo/Idh/MocA family oxidoreductase [Planosporangium thailandense]|uniref:Gfo/Idh/MocA family oxidoreductase n=1 Tax=Planosporangium thailandense TaxID=765197 RepID=A0ABX0XX07_9ACTN|nr:Gfo/Idh/MocA family oxidoreductase [Planosporangium thailandense]NJC70577.1 Gfo/Idh/MocA family oxidoreductase [Planosporangium thailandense]
MEPLRIGILGAARIAELAIVKPAMTTGTRLVVIAARDNERAAAFAAAHGVERAVATYDEVLADPEVDAVYNPLVNGLHATWNLAAIEAGKHVLSEKPFAANAEEAAEVRDAAHRAGVVVADGFHYLYHPVTRRLHELLAIGELGDLVRVETMMMMPDPGGADPRWSLALAGGALMDLGCYSVHAQRVLAPWGGGEPSLTAARAGERAAAPGVDEWLDADLVFPSGATGSARCHMAADRWEFSCRVVGTRGEATAPNFVQPHLDDRVVVQTPDGRRVEHLGTRSSYTYQLEAFTAAVRTGAPMPTDGDDAVVTMRLIDECYRAAGLSPRPGAGDPSR